jgi:hypothetical protein
MIATTLHITTHEFAQAAGKNTTAKSANKPTTTASANARKINPPGKKDELWKI